MNQGFQGDGELAVIDLCYSSQKHRTFDYFEPYISIKKGFEVFLIRVSCALNAALRHQDLLHEYLALAGWLMSCSDVE